jgi:hypothetical protein
MVAQGELGAVGEELEHAAARHDVGGIDGDAAIERDRAAHVGGVERCQQRQLDRARGR